MEKHNTKREMVVKENLNNVERGNALTRSLVKLDKRYKFKDEYRKSHRSVERREYMRAYMKGYRERKNAVENKQ